MSHDPLVRYLEDPTPRRFAEFVTARREEVLNTAYRIVGDASLAEDVAQDVLLRVLHRKTDPTLVRSPRGLLVTMTVNAARSRVRSEVRRRNHEQESVRRREEVGAMDSERQNELREAVSKLPEELRECVEMRYFGGLPLADVAKATGLAIRTVSERLRNARDRLRGRLAHTSHAAMLAFLAGDQEEGLPFLEPSRSFLDRTDRLAGRAGSAAGGARAFRWVLGGLIAVCTVVAIFLGVLDPGPGANEPRPKSPDDSRVAHTTSEDRPDRPAVPPENVAAGPAGGNAGPADAADATTSFSIRVSDERGNLLTIGKLRIRLAGIPDFDQAKKLRKWMWILDEHSLADANPFEVTGLPPAADGLELDLRAQAPGRAPSADKEITIRRGQAREVSLVCPLPLEIPVRVMDRFTQEPLDGAAVVSLTEIRRRKIREAGVLGTAGPGSAVTGPDGRCRVGGLGDEPHSLEVHARGYITGRYYECSLGTQAVFSLEPIRSPGTVVITVLDPDGEPVADLPVGLNGGGGRLATFRRTDAEGRCRFPSIAPGSHVARVDLDAWRARVKSEGWDDDGSELSTLVRVAAGGEALVRLGCIRTGTRVTLVVRDPKGAPRAGVELSLQGAGDGRGKTDETGRVRFEGLQPGTYTVLLDGWFHDRNFTIDAGEEEKEVTLVIGSASIRGRTRPGVSIRATGPADKFTKAGEDGAFEFKNVPPGSYRILAFRKDWLSVPVTVTVEGGTSPSPVKLEMVRGGRILVVFRDPDRPRFANAALRLLDANGTEQILVPDPTGESDRRSPYLLPGRYEIEVTVPDRGSLRFAAELVGGRNTEVEVGAP